MKQRIKHLRHILIYGSILALFIFILKWIQWKFLIIDNAIDIYIGLVAVIFTILGAWVANQIMKPKIKTVVVEKQVYLAQAEKFVLNTSELERLDLSGREYEVLQHIASGYSNVEIAEKLFLSLSTIKSHVSNLYSKMEVKSRTQAIDKAKKLNLIE